MVRPQPPQILNVSHPADVSEARRLAKAAAETAGFDAQASAEIALAVMELASNLVKHAGGGTLRLAPCADGARAGIEVESVDQGLGIADVERATEDGFSTVGSLGYGLGVVNRIMDQLEIASQAGQGTRVVARRYLRPRGANAAPLAVLTSCPLAFGAATRSHPRMQENGDAFVIKRWGENALVGIIDGLGHGKFAYRAAQMARQYVEGHFDQPFADIFRGVERACRATRGVVLSLARFHWGSGIMAFAGVGNVEGRIFGSPGAMSLLPRRGVLGAGAPRPAVMEHPWPSHYLLILHSDGVRNRWQWADISDLAGEPATPLAQSLLRRLAKDDDDATVVVVRGEAP